MNKVLIFLFFGIFFHSKILGQHKYRIHSEMNLFSENSGFSHFDFAIAFYNGNVKMADYDPTWFNVELNEISTQIEYSIFDLPMPVTSLVFYVQDYESAGDYDACLQYSEDLTPVILDLINPKCDHLLILQASEYCNEAFSGTGKLYKIESLLELNPNSIARICEEKTLDIFPSCNNVEYSLEAIVDGNVDNPVPLLPYNFHPGSFTFVPSDLPNTHDDSLIQFQVFYNEDKTESNTIAYEVFPCVPVLDPNVPNNLEGLPVTCHGDGDGGITAIFDRALTAEETMVLTFKIGDDAVHQTNPPLTQSDFEGNTLTYETEEGLPAGEYSMQWDIKIGNDAIGGDEALVTITEPQLITFNLNGTDPTCSGTSDGEIIVADLSGGNEGYSFGWLREGDGFDLPEGSTDTHLINLPTGTYSLLVTDSKGCTSSVQEIELVAQAESPIMGEPLVFQPGEFPNFLPTGSIVLGEVTGGDGNYVYNWVKDGEPFIPDDPVSPTALESGNYTLTIVDNGGSGCPSVPYDFNIIELPPLEIEISETVGITCEGDIGILEANALGGTNGGYGYLWSNGETTKSINVGQGTYSVTVTDNGDSVEEESYEFEYANPLLTVTVTQTNIVCKGEATGGIALEITGGTGGPYTVSWLDDPTDAPIREGLAAGNYVYFVGDGECQLTNVETPIILTEPDVALEVVHESKTNASINGAEDGTLTVSVENGIQPFTYEWTKDGEAFVPPIGSTNTELIDLGVGAYQVLITDAIGCTATLLQPLNIVEPEPLAIVQLEAVPVNCKGRATGTITGNVTGIPPFTFIWEKEGAPNFTAPNASTATGLESGNYTLTVTDASDVPAVTETIFVPEPDESLAAQFYPAPLTCFVGNGGTIQIGASGGSAPYRYSIDGGVSFRETPLFNGLVAGYYDVLVMDANGCEIVSGVTVGQPDQIQAEFAITSQAFVDENIVAVDLSHPIPKTVEWTVPEGVIVMKEDNDALELVFPEAGEYEIGITVYREECWSASTKKVLVLDNSISVTEGQDERNGRKIERFIVYPNPTNGEFYVDIALADITNISLKVFGFASNNLILQELGGGQRDYSVPMDMTGLPSGIYVVILETPFGSSLRKILLK